MSQPNKHYCLTRYSNKLSTHKFLILMPAAAMLGILVLVAVFFASADLTANSYATSVNSEITAEVDGTHYVTLSAPDVTFSINPTDSAQLSKQSINVSVETNAPGGADLYLSMANSTNALHLNGDTASTAPAIEATASSVAASSLAAKVALPLILGVILPTTKPIPQFRPLIPIPPCSRLLTENPLAVMQAALLRRVSPCTTPLKLIPPSQLAPILTA